METKRGGVSCPRLKQGFFLSLNQICHFIQQTIHFSRDSLGWKWQKLTSNLFNTLKEIRNVLLSMSQLCFFVLASSSGRPSPGGGWNGCSITRLISHHRNGVPVDSTCFPMVSAEVPRKPPVGPAWSQAHPWINHSARRVCYSYWTDVGHLILFMELGAGGGPLKTFRSWIPEVQDSLYQKKGCWVSRNKPVHCTLPASESKLGHSSPCSSVILGCHRSIWHLLSGLSHLASVWQWIPPSRLLAISSSLSLPWAGEASWLSQNCTVLTSSRLE